MGGPGKILAFETEGFCVVRNGGQFIALHARADGEVNEITVLGVFRREEAACAVCVNGFYAGIEKRNRQRQGPDIESQAA